MYLLLLYFLSTTIPTNVETLGVVDGLSSPPVVFPPVVFPPALPFILLSNQLLNSFIPFGHFLLLGPFCFGHLVLFLIIPLSPNSAFKLTPAKISNTTIVTTSAIRVIPV